MRSTAPSGEMVTTLTANRDGGLMQVLEYEFVWGYALSAFLGRVRVALRRALLHVRIVLMDGKSVARLPGWLFVLGSFVLPGQGLASNGAVTGGADAGVDVHVSVCRVGDAQLFGIVDIGRIEGPYGGVYSMLMEGGRPMLSKRLQLEDVDRSMLGWAVAATEDIIAVSDVFSGIVRSGETESARFWGRVYICDNPTSVNQELVITETIDAPVFFPKEPTAFRALEGSHAFGASIGLSGNCLAVGDTDSGGKNGEFEGVCFIYKRVVGKWTPTQALECPRDVPSDSIRGFGASTCLFGSYLAVGAPGEGQGCVLVYSEVEGEWVLKDRLLPSISIPWNCGYGQYLQSSGSALTVGVGTLELLPSVIGLWRRGSTGGERAVPLGREDALEASRVAMIGDRWRWVEGRAEHVGSDCVQLLPGEAIADARLGVDCDGRAFAWMTLSRPQERLAMRLRREGDGSWIRIQEFAETLWRASVCAFVPTCSQLRSDVLLLGGRVQAAGELAPDATRAVLVQVEVEPTRQNE